MNDEKQILLCKMKGGSHSYGLNTPESDLDYRGVFVNNDLATVIGLGKHEHQQKQNEQVDEVYTELRNFLRLLRNGNTQMIELLYADPKTFEVFTPEWHLIRLYRKRLLSSEKLFSCLRGYMQGELRLANGERTGKLGGKRKEAIERFGFSPKNFTQLLRLAWAGKIYFQKGYFPVNIFQEDEAIGKHLLEVKTQPLLHSKEGLNRAAERAENELVLAFENRKFNSEFDEELAHKLCLQIYGPIVEKLYSQLQPDSNFETSSQTNLSS
jgi:hypothetical protein